MAALTMSVNPEPTWRIYAALADAAGVTPDVRVHDPRVIVGEMVHDDGRQFVWLTNASDAKLACEPIVKKGSLRELGGGKVRPSVELEPFGVVVLERA